MRNAHAVSVASAAVVAFVTLTAFLMSDACAYDRGHIFVTNRGGNDVMELDNDLVLVRHWFGTAGLAVPNGMAFDPDGNLFVADTGNNRIVVFDSAGTMLRQWSTTADIGMSIESIIIDLSRRVWGSANPGLGRVLRWRNDGTMPVQLVNDPAFTSLGNVNFTPDGHVLVSDFSGTRGIRELDPVTGAVIREFGRGTSRHEDLVVDGDGNMIVSGFDMSTMLVFDRAGTELRRFTAPGLRNPTGVVLTSDCRILVASFGSSEIYEFRFTGEFIRRLTHPGLSMPESLSIAGLSVVGSPELLDPVPVCRPVPDGGVDANVDVASDATGDASPFDSSRDNDGGTGDGGRDARVAADARSTGDPPGCACRAAPGRANGAPFAWLVVAILAAMRLQIRFGASARPILPPPRARTRAFTRARRSW